MPNFNKAPEFKPHFTPLEILSRGAFGGNIFAMTSHRVGVPSEILTTQSDRWGRPIYTISANYYNVDCFPQFHKTPGLIPPMLMSLNLNWFHWYCQFYYNKENPAANVFRIEEWRNAVRIFCHKLKIACQQAGIQVSDDTNNSEAIRRLRQLLLHYGWDSKIEYNL